MIKKHPSPNFNERLHPISLVILHYTEMESAKTARDLLCDPNSQVSAHYLIAKTGEITQMVEDEKRAWHAGVSFWKENRDINGISLGIELDNGGHQHGLPPYPDIQLNALMNLLNLLRDRHDFPPENVIGHSDVAPLRKKDPGEHFPWKFLSQQGFGTWPKEIHSPTPLVSPEEGYLLLRDLGYEIKDLTATITAFQRHFTPLEITGTFTQSCLETLMQLSFSTSLVR